MESFTLFLRGVPDDRVVRLGQIESGKVRPIIPGNSRLDLLCQVPDDQRHYLDVYGPVADEEFTGPAPTAIVNCVSDPESMGASLTGARDLIALSRKNDPAIIVVNHPDSVLRLRRDTIYQQFHGLPGIVIPRTVRIKPQRVDDVFESMDRFGLKFPILIRPTRKGVRRVLTRIEGPQDRDLLERLPYDGREFFLTNLRETTGSSGLHRKLRIVIIRGEFYAQHLIFSDHWDVGTNSRNRIMKSRPDIRDVEKEFLDRFDKNVDAQARESIGRISQLLALDFLVVDCAPATDGRILIFEIHAWVDWMDTQVDGDFPYLDAHAERIRAACRELVQNPALPTDNFWAGFANS